LYVLASTSCNLILNSRSQRACNSHRGLATHLARASASSAALSNKPPLKTPPQSVPQVASDDLPMISMDDRKVAIGWDTRTWSRL
jgi:trimethyllysine dioxygenase